ncbi:hypothetical protein B0J18DRAFT_485486 [Chaetomium sp. MPI-SDFR-AT-0129]|nr:hypothetical protein B0J18DRAFT_485486 [Chaetomium sp. MPI-SDFR-AT-0129]
MDEVVRQKHRGWASCAAVNRDWQVVIARANFRRLNLSQDDVHRLNEMTSRHRSYVQYIYFHIDLPRYSCLSCSALDTLELIRQTSCMVAGAMVQLLSALVDWPAKGQLTLEIAASSPSDTEHWFKHFQFGYDNGEAGGGRQHPWVTPTWHDPGHG